MDQFISVLLTMTAAATAAALAVMVLRILLKKAPRWLTCALWLLVFLRMVCPVSFQAPVSLVPDTLTQTAQQAVSLPVRQTADPVQPEPQSAPVSLEPAQEEILSVPQAETITLSQVLFPLWAV
ncbi:MAG: M56 family metallopeptidase, partial [Evtepia sp.]